MGIFDRFGRGNESQGRTFDARPVEPSEDEQALARYRYMLRTAPPEAIEQAHAEAFAQLTPQQRRMLLEQLLAEVPEGERRYATDNPQGLARLATRAEVRQPGIMERVFSQVPAAVPASGASGPGFGGMVASSLLGSLAGSVIGTAIAQNMFGDHWGHGGHGHEGGHGFLGGDHDAARQDVAGTGQDPGSDYSDISSALDDFGSGFDGSIDV